MTRSIRIAPLAALAMLALLAGLHFPGLSASQSPPPAPDRIVVGQLLDGVTGKPVGNALVAISSGATAVPQPVGGRAGATPEAPGNQRIFTDDSGRFMFHSLPAGSYALAATLNGYHTAQFGQTRVSGSSTRLELSASGQRVTNVTMKIWKQGSITGTVRDETGEPIGGVRLSLIVVTGPASQRLYSVRNTGTTDDRGVYRIGELPPGDYAVQIPSMINSVPAATVIAYLDGQADRSGNRVRDELTASGGTLATAGQQIGDVLIYPMASRGGLPTQLTIDPKGRMLVYPQTYHPGVPTITAATIVTLASGVQRTGVDIVVRPVPAFRVSGILSGASGPAANTAVKIVPAGPDGEMASGAFGGEIATAVTRPDGTFTALGVPAGRYTATVLKRATPPSVDGPAPTDLRLWWAETPLTVTDADVAKLQLDLTPGVTIAGRMEFESSGTPPDATAMQRLRISLRPKQGQTPVSATVSADGTFTSPQIRPGSYNLSALPPPGYAFKELRIGGRDVSGEPITLTESGIRDVVAIFTDKAGELTGSVTKRATDGDIAVYAVPVDPRIPSQLRPALLLRVLASGDNTFRFASTIPGEYIVAAASADGPEIDAADPRVAAALARLGTRVTVGEKEKKSVTVPVVVLR